MKIGCGFCLQWVIATLVGFGASLYWVEIGEKVDVRTLEAAVGGLVIGVAQWFVLRQRISQAGWWIFVSVLSWGLIGFSGFGAWGWAVPGKMLHIPQRAIFGAVSGGMIGALLGVAQWLVLRKQIPKARGYILSSTISWAIALVISWTAGELLRVRTGIFLGEVLGLILGWVVVAVLTGVALTWLLRSSGKKHY